MPPGLVSCESLGKPICNPTSVFLSVVSKFCHTRSKTSSSQITAKYFAARCNLRTLQADDVSKQELLIAAQKIGVSPRQFERWRKAGLIPAPRLERFGRGKGTTAFYPSSTIGLLEAIAKAHSIDLRLDYVAVRVWLSGLDIPENSFGPILHRVNKNWLVSSKPRNKRQQVESLLEQMNSSSEELHAARETVFTLATGASMSDAFAMQAFIEFVFPNRNSVEGFERHVAEPLKQAVNSKVLSSRSIESSLHAVTLSEQRQLRNDLFRILSTFGQLLNIPEMSTDQTAILDRSINVRQIANLSLICLHLRKSHLIDDMVFEAGSIEPN